MSWIDFPWAPRSDRSVGNSQGDAASEAEYPVAGEEATSSAMSSWSLSSSPTLQRIYQGLEEQQRIIDQLKQYLEERLAPFQRHVCEQRRHIEQALRHLERRLKLLRQYLQGQHENLEQVMAHLDAGLREQFGAFEQFLTSQRGLLEEANHYIEERPRPIQTYLEDEQQIVEMIYRDFEQRLDHLLQSPSEHQKILESLREPEVTSECEALAEYLEERQKALDRYSSEDQPAELFVQLDEAANRYQRPELRRGKLFAKIFEETRRADEKLREALSVAGLSPLEPSASNGHPPYFHDSPFEAS